MECLVIRLYGPMASWGHTAIGGVRPTASMPTRSALIGLLAAALGIKRHEEDKLSGLSESVEFAVKAESEGTLLRDYHTAQVPTADKKALWLHRKAELENAGTTINTVLSTRDYRTDGHWRVAITSRPGARFSLADLGRALIVPRFPLFLGRKSCPLAAPLNPQLLAFDSLHEALEQSLPSIACRESSDTSLYQQEISYEWEGDSMGIANSESWQSWDQPASRKRWQFVKRLVHGTRMKRSG